MRPRLTRAARITVTTVKVATVAAIAAAGTTTAPTAPATSVHAGLPSYSGYAVADRPSPVDRMLDAHRCSVTGFDDASQPTSAVVRSSRGRLRFVDFATGWTVYIRHGAATLVAVCLDDPPAQN
jgi:hypothetical protein